MVGPKTAPKPAAPPAQGSAESSLQEANLPSLKSGDRGDAVLRLQQELNEEGFKLGQDGKFGPGTKKAVVAFQAREGLTPDGVVGRRTWDRLLDVDDGTGAAPAVPSDARVPVSQTKKFGDWRDAALEVSGGDREFQALMAFVRRWEGGFTVDHAGPTNYGIMQPFFDQYRKDNPDSTIRARSVRELYETEAIAIYHAQIWRKAGAGEVAQGAERAGIFEEGLTPQNSTALLAVALGNGAINYGPGRATRFMQQAFSAAGIHEGDLGDRAEAAARAGAVQKVLHAYLDLEERHYRDTGAKTKYAQYLKGWLNRHNSLEAQLNAPLDGGIPSGLLKKDIR